jgi:hypothetical protein
MAGQFDFRLGPIYTTQPMRRMVGMVVVATLAIAPLVVRAQDEAPAGTETKPAADKPVEKKGTELPQGGELDLGDMSKLSNEEKQGRAERSLVDIRDALKRVTAILSEARTQKDIVQLNCVNEKLTQIKGLLRIAEDASSRMYDALGTNTQDVVNHEFTKIAVAHQKAQLLRAEAEQCVGELSVYTGETEITVVVGPEIYEYDPTKPNPEPSGPIAPVVPPPASPT